MSKDIKSNELIVSYTEKAQAINSSLNKSEFKIEDINNAIKGLTEIKQVLSMDDEIDRYARLELLLTISDNLLSISNIANNAEFDQIFEQMEILNTQVSQMSYEMNLLIGKKAGVVGDIGKRKAINKQVKYKDIYR
jgi:tetrahydromethanopterin S-methyltransferase subunit G